LLVTVCFYIFLNESQRQPSVDSVSRFLPAKAFIKRASVSHQTNWLETNPNLQVKDPVLLMTFLFHVIEEYLDDATEALILEILW